MKLNRGIAASPRSFAEAQDDGKKRDEGKGNAPGKGNDDGKKWDDEGEKRRNRLNQKLARFLLAYLVLHPTTVILSVSEEPQRWHAFQQTWRSETEPRNRSIAEVLRFASG